jgi:anti-anti-sigma regulatory factor
MEAQLPVTVELQETQALISLKGSFTINSATELKSLLLECATSGKDLVFDLVEAVEIDVSTLQLLFAAAREAERAGLSISSRLSDAAAITARDAGFANFPRITQG